MTTDPKDAEIARLTARAEKAEADCDQGQRDYCDLKDRHDAHFSAWQSAKLRAEKAEAALSESQALLAEAYEVAARLCDETADEALEESGPASRMLSVWFKGQAKAIRALTHVDAQAALDARINAAREEGRVMGLREGADVADHFRDSCGECNWPEDAVLVGVNVADDIARAILAKIKETDHE